MFGSSNLDAPGLAKQSDEELDLQVEPFNSSAVYTHNAHIMYHIVSVQGDSAPISHTASANLGFRESFFLCRSCMPIPRPSRLDPLCPTTRISMPSPSTANRRA